MRIRKRTFYTIIGIILLVFVGIGCVREADLTPTASQSDEDDSPAEAGNDTSQPVSDNNPALPAAPSNLSADHVSIFDVLMEWEDTSDNEDGFRVYRRRLDIASQLSLVGETGVDETALYDEATQCGATYQYIVASYNQVGESPTHVCWQITLPPCNDEQTVELGFGPDNGYDFINRTASAGGDFYLLRGDDGQVEFYADGEDQHGLISLGNLGRLPLQGITLPRNVTYNPGGVPARVGETYAVRAHDGASIVIFRLESLEDTALIKALVWFDIDLIEELACEDLDPSSSSLTVNLPGNPCVSGDGVCDPTCSSPPPDVYGRPVPADDSGEGLVMEEAAVMESRDDVSDAEREFMGARRDCLREVMAAYPPPLTPEEEVAAREAFEACMADVGYPRGGSGDDGPDRILLTDDESSGLRGDGPTFTPRDLDCGDQNTCVPNDGYCDATCDGRAAWAPPGYEYTESRDIDGDGVDEALFGWPTSDTPTHGDTWIVDLEDRDCYPHDWPDTIRHCGPEAPPELTDDFAYIGAADPDGDGIFDVEYYINTATGQNIVWDTDCDDPGLTYLCSEEQPDEITSELFPHTGWDDDGDGIYDRIKYIDLDTGHVYIWDKSCGDPSTQLICSPRKLSAITDDYELVSAVDQNGDGVIDLHRYVNTNPDSLNYGNVLIWNMLCDQSDRLYWCGLNEPTWLNDDYTLIMSTETTKTYENTNPDSSQYGSIGHWDFGPNCAAPPITPSPTPPINILTVELNCGLRDFADVDRNGYYSPEGGDYWVGEAYNTEECLPDDDPGGSSDDDDDDDDCDCKRVCVQYSAAAANLCVDWDHRDTCTGKPCNP